MNDLELATRLITQARQEWLDANDPKDGTDVVTPYDEWFYTAPECDRVCQKCASVPSPLTPVPGVTT